MAADFRNLAPLEIQEGSGAWEERVPLGPPDLRHGTLGNGLQYYVRTIRKPKARASVSLAVKVGSVLERDDEQGVAHFVEHLAFNATEDYSSHAIVRFLESIGASFGACQNAITSTDETIYELLIPTDDPKFLTTAFSVLAQFAAKIRCLPEDIDKERGAILEEWRGTRDSLGRIQEAQIKCILAGSRYADRLPIGLERIIKTVPASTVRAFYQRWYRPEHMAVFCVGDFDSPDAVVEQIRTALGQVQGSADELAEPIPRHVLVPHSEPRYLAYVDPEAQSSNVTVAFKHPAPSMSRPCDYLQHCRETAFRTALNNRFYRIGRRPDPPFFVAAADSGPLSATIVSHSLAANVSEGANSIVVGLQAILLEVARARLHGFSQREVDAACRQLLSDFETTYLERDQVHSIDWRNEYERNFLNDEFVAGREYETRLAKAIVPLVKPADLQEVARLYHPTCSCVVQAACYRRSVSEDALREVVARVQELEETGAIAPWEEQDAVDSVLPPGYAVAPGSVVSSREWPNIGAKELRLSNGMKITFKATRWLDDQVLLNGWASGGLTDVSRKHFHSCSLAFSLAMELGHLGLKPEVLADLLIGKRVQLDVTETAFYRKFGGEQSPLDLELTFQMIHRLFTHTVQPIPEELQTCLKITREGIIAQLRNPTSAFLQKVRAINYGDCFFFRPMTIHDLDKVDPEVACEHFNECFLNPSEFHITLTGNVEEEQLVALAERWLASIPASSEPPPRPPGSLTRLNYKFPSKVVVETVRARMVESRSQALLTFPMTIQRTSPQAGVQQAIWAVLVCQLLETKLLQVLRFQAGQVYNVSVAPNFTNEPPSATTELQGDLKIGFTCDPEVVQLLIELALAEVERLQREGPSEEDISTILTVEQRGYEAGLEENGYWHDMVVSSYQSRSYIELDSLDAVYKLRMDARDHVRSRCTPDAMRDALCRLLPHPCRLRYTSIFLVPRQPLLKALLPTTLTKAGIWLAGAAVIGLSLAAFIRRRSAK